MIETLDLVCDNWADVIFECDEIKVLQDTFIDLQEQLCSLNVKEIDNEGLNKGGKIKQEFIVRQINSIEMRLRQV